MLSNQPFIETLTGMDAFLIGIALLLAGGVAAIFLPEKIKAAAFSFMTALAVLMISFPASSVLFGGDVISQSVSGGYPLGEIAFVIDPLAAFFILLIGVMSFVGTLYAIGYLKPYLGKKMLTGSHFLFFAFFIIFMLLVVVIRNALAFLIVWELMSLASFFLVVFEHEKKEVLRAGLYYLIAMHAGVAFLITGFVILAIHSGSLDFDSFKPVFASDPNLTIILFTLFFVGFGLKAGFVPFHTWLPKAHPAAPSHISGMMSGIMIKTGIYGILRIVLLMGTPPLSLSYGVLAISLITAVLGVMYAITQHDLKKLLAYHSVENIGIIGIGIGIGMLGLAYDNHAMTFLGFAGALLHTLNHSIFKGLLFYGAGAVYRTTHTLDIEELGGLARKMKITSFCFLIGSLAISGIPPFNGFISEFIIYIGMIKGSNANSIALVATVIASIVLLAFVGAMALLCFTKAYGIVFLGNPRSRHAVNVNEAGHSMQTAMLILVLLCALIGIFPQYAIRLIIAPVQLFAGDPSNYAVEPMFNLLADVSSVCILFIGITLVLFLLRHFLLQGKSVSQEKTWDCGYQAGNPRMQYSASSYAAPFVGLTGEFLNVREEVELPRGYFPAHARFMSEAHDIFETFLINPLTGMIRKFLDLFAWIQSGNTQQYVLYGLVFLIIILIWGVGVR